MQHKKNIAFFILIIAVILIPAYIIFDLYKLEKTNLTNIPAVSLPEKNSYSPEANIEEEAPQKDMPPITLENHQELVGTYSLDIGNWHNAVLALMKDKVSASNEIYGKIFIPDAMGKYSHDNFINIPHFTQALSETAELTGVEAVESFDIEKDGSSEIIILTKGKTYSEENNDIYTVAILSLQNNQLEPLRAYEEFIGNKCSTIDCVLNKCQTIYNLAGNYHASSNEITADLTITLDYPGPGAGASLKGTWDAVYGANAHTCIIDSFDLIPIIKNAASFYRTNEQNVAEEFASGIANNNVIETTFSGNMSEFDCGSDHPGHVTLIKK